MDVHRSRFVRYPTSAISALAFTRPNDDGYTGALPPLRLAIGRANGNIEILNPQKGLWVQETVFVGDGISIDGLTWTQDPDDTDGDGKVIPGQYRLFSIASSISVTEWNLGTGRPKRQSTGNFSELWCMSAQPKSMASKNRNNDGAQAQDLVAGCGDGTIVLLSTADDDLQFKRFLSRSSGTKARCICITYQSQDRVVAGFVDNMIRIYDTRNGSLIRTMSLGIGAPGRPRNTLIWQVRCLPNGDIVSADSGGEVKFWDGKTYSLLQRIESHDSDCLDLAISNDGRTVFSGGIDGKIAVHHLSTNSQARKSWSKTSHRRIHNGEVKVMATYDSKGMSVVVSGGADIAPVVTPMRAYGKENIRTLPGLPQSSPVLSAPKARLLVSWWENSIYIWKIAKLPTPDIMEDVHRPRKLVARITLDTESNIRSLSITSDGKLLAVSTENEIKMFQLRKRYQIDTLAIRKVQLPDDLSSMGSRLMRFSPDGKWLAVVSHGNEVHVARVADDQDHPKRLQILPKLAELDRRHRQSRSPSAFKDYDRTITQLAFANDSSIFVASDLSGYLDSWVLEGGEDLGAPALSTTSDRQLSNGVKDGSDSDSDSSEDYDDTPMFFGQHWTENRSGHLLPKLDAPPLVLSFRPVRRSVEEGISKAASTQHNRTEQQRLWILTAKHQMLEFNVLGGRLSDCSRRNPTAALPEDFKKILGRVMGAIWDVTEQRERIWLYGESFMCMLNLGTDLSDGSSSQPQKKRRKSKGSAEEDGTPKRRRLGSGAGGPRDPSQQSAAPNVVGRYEGGTWTEMDFDGQDEAALGGEEESGGDDLQLARVDETHGREAAHADSSLQRKFWCTFKYRPILGMVALEDDMDVDEERPPEVVIVERPHWDVQKDSRGG